MPKAIDKYSFDYKTPIQVGQTLRYQQLQNSNHSKQMDYSSSDTSVRQD